MWCRCSQLGYLTYLSGIVSAAEHPKAGLIKNMEKGVMADEGDEPQGRRSKTPIGSDNRKMEAHRYAGTTHKQFVVHAI